ncbi:MAG: type 1 pili tip component [Porticoccus sp.]|nr:type 1 pili tip component [Porticoccus sp.]MBQ0808163.1 type 1 pili tip component [Porticoccus sp.]
MNNQGDQRHQQGFSQLLGSWEKRSTDNADLIATTIAIHEPDQIKLQALAELYQLPEGEITGHLLRHALKALETEMPYIPGSKVIRIEEGDEIYEDIGPLPRYLEAQKQLRNKVGV